MKQGAAAAVSALAFGVIGCFVGPAIGFTGLLSALVLGAAGAFFGPLVVKVGAKAFLIPMAAGVAGLVLVLLARLMSLAAFDAAYYVFVPLFVAVVVTPFASIVFQVFPSLRIRVLGKSP